MVSVQRPHLELIERYLPFEKSEMVFCLLLAIVPRMGIRGVAYLLLCFLRAVSVRLSSSNIDRRTLRLFHLLLDPAILSKLVESLVETFGLLLNLLCDIHHLRGFSPCSEPFRTRNESYLKTRGKDVVYEMLLPNCD